MTKERSKCYGFIWMHLGVMNQNEAVAFAKEIFAQSKYTYGIDGPFAWADDVCLVNYVAEDEEDAERFLKKHTGTFRPPMLIQDKTNNWYLGANDSV